MSFPRATGILLHPTSLPSRGGIGDFGPAAYEFLNFLTEARQGLWQVLPLGPPANGASPYSSTSAFAGNPLLISLERLVERGWLEHSRISGFAEPSDKVHCEEVTREKLPLLCEAATNFLTRASGHAKSKFDHFCQENNWWLDDFVLFEALRSRYNKQRWNRWPQPLARREPEAIDEVRNELAAELMTRKLFTLD